MMTCLVTLKAHCVSCFWEADLFMHRGKFKRQYSMCNVALCFETGSQFINYSLISELVLWTVHCVLLCFSVKSVNSKTCNCDLLLLTTTCQRWPKWGIPKYLYTENELYKVVTCLTQPKATPESFPTPICQWTDCYEMNIILLTQSTSQLNGN